MIHTNTSIWVRDVSLTILVNIGIDLYRRLVYQPGAYVYTG